MARKAVYSKQAIKALQRMPTNQADRIHAKIDQYLAEPESLARNVKRLQGVPYCRLRVGDWRVVFNDQGLVLYIVRIAPRGAAYD